MSSERTRRVLDLVAQALDVEPERQADWLRDACQGDLSIFEEAAELLGLAADAEGFLPVDANAGRALADGPGRTQAAGRDRTPSESPPTTEFSPGSRIGDHDIEEQVGAGGMGIVYRARQVSLNRAVALKVLPASMRQSQTANTRFRREIEAAAGLHHTNIVSVYSTGEHDGAAYYAMELIDGPPLSRLLNVLRAKPIPELEWAKLNAEPLEEVPTATTPDWAVSYMTGANTPAPTLGATVETSLAFSSGDYFDRIAIMLADAADALHYAHEHGVVHRDIKPSNMLLSREGRLHITDFGLARLVHEPRLTRTGEMLGTPYYMAPEQITVERDVDGRADVYALGATLYELLTLRPPFVGENREQIIRQIVENDPVAPRRFNRRTPLDLQTICLKALQKSPEDRYDTAGQMAADLRAYVQRFAISARPIGWISRGFKWARRHPALSSMLSVACAFAMVALFFAVRAHQTKTMWDVAQQRQVFEQALMAALEGKTAHAEEALEQARKLQAPEGEIQLLEGQIAYMGANYSAAYGHFQRAAQQMPSNVSAQSLLGLVHMKQLRYQQGESSYHRVQSLPPETLEDFLHRARLEAYFDPGKASRTLNEAVIRERSSLVARLVRAEVQYSRALDTADLTIAEQALEDYRIAQQLLGDTPTVTSGLLHSHLAAANACRSAGQTKLEQVLLESAKDLAEQHAESRSYRTQRAVAFCCEAVGDSEGAIEQQRRFQHRQVLYLVLTLLREGRYTEARQACLKVRRGPTVDRMLSFFRMMITAMELETEASVREAFDVQGEIMIDPIHEMLIVYTFACLVETTEQRQEHCRRILDQKPLPSFRHAWYQKLAQFVCGEISEEQFLDAAAGSRKSLCEAHYYVGASAVAEGDRAKARRHFEAGVHTGVYSYFEYYLSKTLAAHLTRKPDWPAWRPPTSEEVSITN